MKKSHLSIILFLTLGIIQSCSSNKEIRALYENRPCSQPIVMNPKAECIERKSPEITPVNGLTMEDQLAFEKQKAIVCPEYKKLNIYRWEIAVYFDYTKHALTKNALQKLDQNVHMLKKQPEFCLSIRGYTDNRGSHDYNQRLAHRRAMSVFNYLMHHGIHRDRMILSPVGETAPLLPNNTEENMAVNRRVEMLLLNHDGKPVPYMLSTSDTNTLLDPDITQSLFCKIWTKRIQWFPGILFNENQRGCHPIEMNQLKKNLNVMTHHSGYMVSIREFSSSNNDDIQKNATALRRLQYLETFFNDNAIEKKRIQVIAPEETHVFQTIDNKHYSQNLPCVELLLLDQKARPIPLIVITQKKI